MVYYGTTVATYLATVVLLLCYRFIFACTAGWYSHFLKFPVHKFKNTYHKKILRLPLESARRVLARWTSFGEKILKLKKNIFWIFLRTHMGTVRYSISKKAYVVVQNTWENTWYKGN